MKFEFVLILGVLAPPAAGCGARAERSTEAAESREPSGAPTICTPEGECSQVDCGAIWQDGPLPDPWWQEGAPAECAASLSHEPRQAYDDCSPDSSGATPEQCGAPRAGVIFCDSTGERSKVTVSCLRDSDCPEGFACTVGGAHVDAVPEQYFSGTCEKTCDGAGHPAECIRCDMECDALAGLCRFRALAPDPVTECEADCQCPAGVCLAGRCQNDLGRGRQALCGTDCGCSGGECRGQCCYRADGSVVKWREDPLCQ